MGQRRGKGRNRGAAAAANFSPVLAWQLRRFLDPVFKS